MITRYPTIGAKYLHYKGGLYEVITLATHTETQESMVVYRSLLFGSVHVRPLSMWFDTVRTEKGSETERFVLAL